MENIPVQWLSLMILIANIAQLAAAIWAAKTRKTGRAKMPDELQRIVEKLQKRHPKTDIHEVRIPTLGMELAFVREQRGAYKGLFVETKIKGGKLTEKQEQAIKSLRNQGYAVGVCFSEAEAHSAAGDYMKGKI